MYTSTGNYAPTCIELGVCDVRTHVHTARVLLYLGPWMCSSYVYVLREYVREKYTYDMTIIQAVRIRLLLFLRSQLEFLCKAGCFPHCFQYKMVHVLIFVCKSSLIFLTAKLLSVVAFQVLRR